MKKPILIFSALIAIGLVLFLGGKALSPTNPTSQNSNSTSFDKQKFSLEDPASIWVVVNKKNPLNPRGFKPSDLVMPNVPQRVPGHESMQVRQIIASELENLFTSARGEGVNLLLASGYRSYDYQVGLYDEYVNSIGQMAADEQSARPGYSEHQTGLAVDVEPENRKCELEQCFGDTPEGKWVAANAHGFGFIIRYTPDKRSVTGYQYEPWHLRYVGRELAAELYEKNIKTLEEFFGISGGVTYN